MIKHADRDAELLSSLMDGELEPREAEAIRQRLAEEPTLAQRLAAMQRAEERLRAAYAPVIDEPLPIDLVALLTEADLHTAPTESKVVQFSKAAPRRSFFVPSSIAAGIALVVGIGLGFSLDRNGGLTETEQLLTADALITPDTELFGVFESAPSSTSASLSDGLAATPRLSFQVANGGYCRELTVSAGNRESAVVGCRETTGWEIQAVIQVSVSGNSATDNGFRPASDPTSALDAIVEGLIEGVPLGTDAERAAIAAGWE